MADIRVTSHGQRSGITAYTVNIRQGLPAPPEPPPPPPAPWWKTTWAVVFGGVLFVAAIVAILEWLGVAPLEHRMSEDKTTHVTSTNQQGGITADTVNIGSQPYPGNNSIPGSGGAAYSEGHGNLVKGGKGSAPGLGGAGGPGGNAYSKGDANIVIGGDAGAAGRNPGDGGSGGNPGAIGSRNNPTFQRALVVNQLLEQYLAAHKDAPAAYTHSPPQVPEDWMNQRLQQMGETWRVKNAPPGQGYNIVPTPEQ
jgi:hypothetical protein